MAANLPRAEVRQVAAEVVVNFTGSCQYNGTSWLWFAAGVTTATTPLLIWMAVTI
jgi:hypothetical protein